MILQRQSKSRRRRNRRTFILCVLAGIAVMLYLILGPVVKRRFQTWQYQRQLAQAADGSETKDPQAPALSLQTSLHANAGNPAAWRMAADWLDYTGDRTATSLREQIIQLEPTVAENRFALVRTALRFRDAPAAHAALDALPAEARDSAEGKRLAAAAVLIAGRSTDADELLGAALASEKDPARAKLERLFFRLRYGNFSQASNAREELLLSSRLADFRPEILRELIYDDLRRNDSAAARSRVETLLNLPQATFQDRLLRADLTVAASPEKIPLVQAELTPLAAPDATHAVLLAGWLANYGRTASATTFLESLAPEIRDQPTVRAALAGLAIAKENWPLTTQLIAAGAWGHIEPESVQLALSARLLDTRERPELRREVWNSALTATEKELSGLQVLRRLALLWKWDDEYEITLFHIARRFPQETWAHQLLAENYLRKKQTAGLKSVYALWHEANPADARVEITWHYLELLSKPVTAETPVNLRVRQLYETAPTSPFFATVQALSLSQLGENDAALSTLDKLPAAERRAPSRAFYYALYLATAKRLEEARTYLEVSSETALLPEERALLNRARSLAAVGPKS
ncbi:hypothetical protein [Oleiharenicola lentus]|uniref:hypothetical protein n=1 Tax=Oleiharenicola lentus TaxID=2508720 RepID=UPI003F6725D2